MYSANHICHSETCELLMESISETFNIRDSFIGGIFEQKNTQYKEYLYKVMLRLKVYSCNTRKIKNRNQKNKWSTGVDQIKKKV